MMTLPTFTGSLLSSRPAIQAAHREAWTTLSSPGAWWTGAERVAIMAETRKAMSCRLCTARLNANPRSSVQGEHDTASKILPAPAVEAIHRIRTDTGYLSRPWLKKLLVQGLSEGAYVELCGVLVNTLFADTFCRAMGLPLHDLPEPRDGEPSGYIPEGLADESAWVRTVPAAIVQSGKDADVYPTPSAAPDAKPSFVNRGLSQAPNEMRTFMKLCAVHYIPWPDIGNFPTYATHRKGIDALQIELVASRVSAINRCFYCATYHIMFLGMHGRQIDKKIELGIAMGDTNLGDAGVQHGRLLVNFVEGVMGRDDQALDRARAELHKAMGDVGLIDAAGIVATFNAINRIVHPTGVPIDPHIFKATERMRDKLGINEFDASRRAEV